MRKELTLLAACLLLAGCEEIGFVEKSKYDSLQEQRKQLQDELNKAREDLKKAEQQVSDCQAHKYQIYHEGLRTWRLDSVTGKTCILLTSEQDWKSPKTTESGCNCEDAMNDPNSTFDVLNSMGCFGKHQKD